MRNQAWDCRKWAAALGCVLALAGQTGCGGGGYSNQNVVASPSGSGTIQTAARSVTVALPAGYPTPLRNLTVLNGSGSAPINPYTGSVSLSLLASEIPGLTLVQDSTGTTVLAGFVNSKGGSGTISVKDTSVALLFFGVGGYRLPAQYQQALLDTIAKQPVAESLAQTLATLMISNPTVLSSTDTTLDQALQSAIQTLLAVPAPSARARAVAAAVPGSQVFDLRIEPAATLQSGAEIDISSTAAGAFTISNTFRRKTVTYLYKVGTIDSQGTVTALSPGVQSGSETAVSGTQSLGSLLGLFQQAVYSVANVSTDTAFVPQVSAPITPTPDPTAAKTQFTAVTVGSTFSTWNVDFGSTGDVITYTGVLPPAYSSPALASFRDRWINQSKQMSIDAYFYDVVIPLVDTMVGLVTLSPDADISTLTSGVIGEFQNAYNYDWLTSVGLSNDGSTVIPGNIASQVPKLILSGLWRPLTLKLFDLLKSSPKLRGAVVDAFARGASTGPFLAAVGRANFVMSAINIGLSSTDIEAVYDDLKASNAADSWNITAIAGKVTLTPANQAVTDSSTATFTAHAPSVEGLSLIYHWSVSGSLGGTLSDTNNHINLRDFVSTSGNVTYLAPSNGVANATDVVTVNVSVLSPTGTNSQEVAQPVGSATANVTYGNGTLVDGDFSSPATSPGLHNDGFVNFASGDSFGPGNCWQVVGGGVSVTSATEYSTTTDAGYVYYNGPGSPSGQYLDLTGPTDNGSVGGVTQSVNTVPNAQYTVSFSVGAYNGPAIVNATVNGNSVGLFTVSSSGDYPYFSGGGAYNGNGVTSLSWASKSYTFTATGSTTVFGFFNGTPAGPTINGLTDITLTRQ